jgi:Domain of unknown function (DU1801)
MAPKTTPTAADVDAFLNAIEDPGKREDSHALCRMMAEETGEPPTMWGPSIVGFGSYHYRYASGREGDWMALGFSPRRQSLTLYLMDGFSGYGELLERLGKHSTGKSCLYVKRLSDVDTQVLREMVRRSYAHTAGR